MRINARVAMDYNKDYDFGSEYVEISLPCLPRVGEFLFLSDKDENILINKIIGNSKELNLAIDYIYTRKPYFTSEQLDEMEYEQLKEIAVGHLSLSDLIKVSNIIFDSKGESDEYIVTIYLGK